MSVDCSIEAQADRKARLEALRAKLFSGMQSVSDRSRSIGYFNDTALAALIARLEREQDVCNGVSPRRRLYHVPMVKGL
jgi:hypothetical protein